MNPSSFIASSLNSSGDLDSQLVSIINLTANIVKSIHACEKTECYQDLVSLSLPQNQLSGNYKLSKSNDTKDLDSLKLKDKPALLTENKNILSNKLLRSNDTDERYEKCDITLSSFQEESSRKYIPQLSLLGKEDTPVIQVSPIYRSEEAKNIRSEADFKILEYEKMNIIYADSDANMKRLINNVVNEDNKIEKSVCCENKKCEVSPVIINDTKSSFHSHSEVVPNVQNMDMELLKKNKTSYNSENFNLPSKDMLYSNQLINDSRSHFENSLPNMPVGIAADCEDSDSDSIVFIGESSNSFSNKLADNNMNAQNENNIQSEEFIRAKCFKYTEQTDKSHIDAHKITEQFLSNINENVVPEVILNSSTCFNVHAKNSIDKLPTLSELLNYNRLATKYSDAENPHSCSGSFNLPRKGMIYSNQLVNNSTNHFGTSLPNVPVYIEADCEDSTSDSFSFVYKSSNSCTNKLLDNNMNVQNGNNIQSEEFNRTKRFKYTEQTDKSVIDAHKITEQFRSNINENVVPEAILNSSTCFNVHAKNNIDKLPTLSELLSYNHLTTKYLDAEDAYLYSESFNLPSKDMRYSNQLINDSTSHFENSLPNAPVCIEGDCEESDSDSVIFVYESNKLPDKSVSVQYENDIQSQDDNQVRCFKSAKQIDKSVIDAHKIVEHFPSNINQNITPEAIHNCFNIHANNSIDKVPAFSEVSSYNPLTTKYSDTGSNHSCSEASVLQKNCERVSAADIGIIDSEFDTNKQWEVSSTSDERILNKTIEPTEITVPDLRKIIHIAQNLFLENKSLDIQSTSNYSYTGTDYVDRMSSSSADLPYKDCNLKFPDTYDKTFLSDMCVNRQNNLTEGQSEVSDVTDIIKASYIENRNGLQKKMPFSCPDNGTGYTSMGMIEEDGENSNNWICYREKGSLKKVQNGNAERLMFNTISKEKKLYEHSFKELSATPESVRNVDVQNEKIVKSCSHFINSLNNKTVSHFPQNMKRSKSMKRSSSETVALPFHTKSKKLKLKGKKLNKRNGKYRTYKNTIPDQPLFTPDKVLKSIPKMNTDGTFKKSDDYNTNRCYGRRVTNRGQFLTEEIVNTPSKIKRGQCINISTKSVFTARVDEFHAMAQSPEIEIVSRRILP